MALSFWIPPFGDLPAYSEGALGPATAHWTMGQLTGSISGWENLADSGDMGAAHLPTDLSHLHVQQLSQ